MLRPVCNRAYLDRFLLCGNDVQLHQTRLRRGSHHGDRGLRGWIHVFYQCQKQTVGDVWGKVESLRGPFLFAFLTYLHSDFAGGSVDPALHVLLERWTFLHYLIAYEAEFAALSELGDLLVKGAIFEVEFQVVHDDAVFDYLLQVTIGERVGVEVAQDEEAEGNAFDVADGNGIGGCCDENK